MAAGTIISFFEHHSRPGKFYGFIRDAAVPVLDRDFNVHFFGDDADCPAEKIQRGLKVQFDYAMNSAPGRLHADRVRVLAKQPFVRGSVSAIKRDRDFGFILHDQKNWFFTGIDLVDGINIATLVEGMAVEFIPDLAEQGRHVARCVKILEEE